jgi:hypothetical protein
MCAEEQLRTQKTLIGRSVNLKSLAFFNSEYDCNLPDIQRIIALIFFISLRPWRRDVT